MTAPTIALLVPAYNASRFLPRLIDSARRQSPAFSEIWIHDDCSTDNTAEVARALGANVVTSTINIGCTAGKVRLLEKTSCDWVHFHDADDEILEGFTSAAQNTIRANPFVDAIIVGTEERSDIDQAHHAVNIPNAAELAQSPFLFSIKYQVNAICGIYRRPALLETRALSVSDEERYNEDQAIQLNLVTAGARFACIERVLVRSYLQPASMHRSNKLKCLQSQFHVMMRALGHDPSQFHRTEIGEAFSVQLWRIAAGAASCGDFFLADRAIELSRRLSFVPREAGGSLFRVLASLAPKFAVRWRECMIRTYKPHLRAT
ncbi:MAG: glycosyltransferase family 2 protein [Hyphomonadaceae bacterium]|nr:glycosyltransferase family 2 protein [Hyphomonadaceae bacterium]MBY0565126.1 glycosyltransferase family 2 protein [Hyphomonadaceae bacterium]